MTAEQARWLLAAIGSSVVVIVGAVVSLLVVAYRIGRVHAGMDGEAKAREALTVQMRSVGDKLEIVTRLETKVDQLEESIAEERRRFASDWPEMVSRVSALWTKVFSLNEWRKSQGEYGE